MDNFTQKMRLIYSKLFNGEIDSLTKDFIDSSKFNKEKHQSYKKFFSNRKILIQRWLRENNTHCSKDFQKSFKNYKISLHQFRGQPLFTVDEFKKSDNLKEFEERLDLYLQYRQEVHINKDYKHIYSFCNEREEIFYYSIVKWEQNPENRIIITLEKEGKLYQGIYSLEEGNNIFLTISEDNTTHYMLFHDTKDNSCAYIIGVSMGYLTKDNKVPRSQKVVFSKKKLDRDDLLLHFILNETESISASENRFNPHSSEIIRDYFCKYTTKLKQYHTFFSRLVTKSYNQSLYHRLAFREFYAFYSLFERFSKRESYFIMNFQRAFFEAIKTVESIKNISFQVVMQLNDDNLFFAISDKDFKIKNRFLSLSSCGIDSTIVFVVDDDNNLSLKYQNLLTEIAKESLTVRVVKRDSVIHKVNSLDFFFIYTGDERDFVLADPIRDSKDVFKLFINEVTMDEYRIDYRKIVYASSIVE